MLACWEHGHTACGDDFSCAYLNVRTWEVEVEEAPPRPRLVQDTSLDGWEDRHG